jgi:hypothetical protein
LNREQAKLFIIPHDCKHAPPAVCCPPQTRAPLLCRRAMHISRGTRCRCRVVELYQTGHAAAKAPGGKAVPDVGHRGQVLVPRQGVNDRG